MKSTDRSISELGKWFQNSITIKLGIIGFLILILLIPSAMIQDLINERKDFSRQVSDDIGSSWSGSQLLKGPVLTIPIEYLTGSEGEEIEITRLYHLLPERLVINGDIVPKTLSKGIYKTVVYQSELHISGTLDLTPRWGTDGLKRVRCDKAFLTFGISDLKGIKEGLEVRCNEKLYEIVPGSRIAEVVRSGITIELEDLKNHLSPTIDFDIELPLNGSRNISFVPVGKNTEVAMQSAWESPVFNGNFLPDERRVTEKGFTARWNVLEVNRNYPQYWTGGEKINMEESAFGVDLVVPVDHYKKALRSVKYAILMISFTFLIFFLVEVTGKKKIHPFQYILVGLALSLFYLLLLALSEYLNFDVAYGLSALGIIIMVSLYSLSVFSKNRRKSVFLVLALSGVYGFLYIVLRLEDYALLIGSMGLVIILALVMYFTRNISWYSLQANEND